MPTFKSISGPILSRLASQIGGNIGTLGTVNALGAGASIRLHESIEVWMLGAAALLEPTDDLRKLATKTGRWHHQVKVNGIAQLVAKSVSKGPEPEDWDIVESAASPLAGRIENAITWIDQNLPADGEARLLIVPAFQVHAFWIVRQTDQVVVIVAAPPEFSVLETQRSFSTSEFLTRLRSLRHISGLAF